MNAAEIRAEAIERLAFVYHHGNAKSEALQAAARLLVEPFVDALGDLLPTAVEEQLPVCTHKYVCDSSCDLQRRYVTDWRAAG